MKRFQRQFLAPLFCLFLFITASTAAELVVGKEQFKPIPRADLEMKSHPEAPGAHAIILLWELMRDDIESRETEYVRIKILTEEGRKHADVSVPYFANSGGVNNIKARTTRPDGTFVEFSGKAFDKIDAKGRGYKWMTKSFTLPDVQPGSVIEYRYTRDWDKNTIYSSRWTLQQELFVRKANFEMKPYIGDAYNRIFSTFITVRLPQNQMPTTLRSKYYLELENLKPFEKEQYSPPELELKPRVDFFYRYDSLRTADEYWRDFGKKDNADVESFIGNRGGIKAAAATLYSPTDTPEVKLRKIYARVQQIQNLSYEDSKTRQEDKRLNRKENKNVEDVWKNGYGYRMHIGRLFVALARAAGLPASVVDVSQRDEFFFQKDLLDSKQLNNEIASAVLNGKELFFDPGTPFCPFGQLSWENAGVHALRLDRDGGMFITTPNQQSSDSVIRRQAKLALGEDGFKGTISVAWGGQFALRRRLQYLEEDEAAQKKDIQEDVEEWLPAGSKVTVTKISNQRDGESPLMAEMDVELPMVGSAMGSRMIMPLAVFQARSRNPFTFENRVHPVYFQYPYQELDEVYLTLPEGFKVESLPKPVVAQDAVGIYDSKWEQIGNQLRMIRREAVNGIYFPTQYYPALRAFYEKVNNGDQDNVILRSQAVSAN